DLPNKGANVLSRSFLAELREHFTALSQRKDLAGLIIASAKPGVFIAGADITEFVKNFDAPKSEIVEFSLGGRSLFENLTKASFVSVACIDGLCLGGGGELAIQCDRRLFGTNPKAQFGFPEVKLGLFPGWGGTVRTPRMIGLSNAIELCTGGESIDGRTAVLMGLATDVVPSESLIPAAIQLIRVEKKRGSYLKDREKWSKPIPTNPTEMAFLAATASAYIQQQTKGQYPAPLVCLQHMLKTASLDAPAAYEAEAKAFGELFGTPVNRSLVHLFLLHDRNKKDMGIAAKVEPKPIQTAGLFGAGIMGSGITAACIKKGIHVTLSDAKPEALNAGVRKSLEEASYDKVLKGPDASKMAKLVPMVKGTQSDADYAQCDLVLEVVVENPEVKKALYQRIEPLLKPGAILASNTSAISIGHLAEGLKNPDRFVGIHFFNPVRQMPLVEIVKGPKTSDETVVSAVAFAKALGKVTVVVQDGPGFLVNRVLFPYMNEALELIMDGVSLRGVDSAAKAFGMPMGPITLSDVVGMDTALLAGGVMQRAYPDRVVKTPILQAMVQAGRLGQKSGSGFFKYGGSGKKDRAQDDPTVEAILAPLRRDSPPPNEKQATERLFLPMLLEATRILMEKKVRSAADVDLGVINGIGFPPFKGGLMFWADTVGAAKLVEMLKPYEHLGERYKPTPLLLELAASGKKFYDLN
ncbi:MAG TPA: 3-hydroxyacyl-CoA dehydrogenase NAD-binding domain-containing protein, partial [Gemmatales bacterium]|nr:3-hydroxyacyl-CoA dehydrogenase NAD-binding domain-containing protein [Gemmatales bacterium]